MNTFFNDFDFNNLNENYQKIFFELLGDIIELSKKGNLSVFHKIGFFEGYIEYIKTNQNKEGE